MWTEVIPLMITASTLLILSPTKPTLSNEIDKDVEDERRRGGGEERSGEIEEEKSRGV